MIPTFSIVVPVYNGQSTLKACLETIKNQVFSEKIEVIVVDNNSSDMSVAIAKTFEGIKVIRCPKQGRSFARNCGANLSSGEFLAFVDCDVVLDLNWLSEALKYLRSTPVDLLATRIVPSHNGKKIVDTYRYFFASVKSRDKFISLYKFFDILPVVNSAACVIRRSVFSAIGGFEENLKRHEDLELSLRLLYSDFLIGATKKCSSKVYFSGSSLQYLKRVVESKAQSQYADPAFGRVFVHMMKNALARRSPRLVTSVVVLEWCHLLGFLLNRATLKPIKSYKHQVRIGKKRMLLSYTHGRKNYVIKPNLYLVMIENEPFFVSDKLSSVPLQSKTKTHLKNLLFSKPVTQNQQMWLKQSGLFDAY